MLSIYDLLAQHIGLYTVIFPYCGREIHIKPVGSLFSQLQQINQEYLAGRACLAVVVSLHESYGRSPLVIAKCLEGSRLYGHSVETSKVV